MPRSTPELTREEGMSRAYRRRLSRLPEQLSSPQTSSALVQESADALATGEEDLDGLLERLAREDDLLCLVKPTYYPQKPNTALFTVNGFGLLEVTHERELALNGSNIYDGRFHKRISYVKEFNLDRLRLRLQVTPRDIKKNSETGRIQIDQTKPFSSLIHYDPTKHGISKSARLMNSITPVTEGISQSISTQNLARMMDNDTTIDEEDEPFELVLEKPMTINSTLSPNSNRTLEVALHSITFHQHPLMNKETQLVSNLCRLVNLLNEKRQKASVEYTTRKIMALKLEFTHCRANYVDMTSLRNNANSPITRRLRQPGVRSFGPHQIHWLHLQNEDVRLRKLELSRGLRAQLLDVQSLRQLRNTEAHIDRILEWRILDTYEQIKKIRLTQRYQSSGIKLIIQSEECVLEDDLVELNSEIQEELQEAEELKLIHQEIEALEQSSSLVPLTVGNVSTTVPILPATISQQMTLATVSSPASMIDNEALRDEIVNRLNVSRRTPGFPKLSFRTYAHEPATAMFECPMIEQKRRRQIKATRLFIKLYCNDKFVSATEPNHLTVENMKVYMLDTLIIRLQIRDAVSRLSAQIWQKGVLGNELLSEVDLPVPGMISKTKNGPLSMQFSNTLIMANTKVLEQGLFSKSSPVNKLDTLEGELTYETSWDELLSDPSIQNVVDGPVLSDDRYGIMGTLFHRIQRLASCFNATHVEWNDADNVPMNIVYNAIASVKTLLSIRSFFRLIGPPELGPIKNARRLQLLQLRGQEQLRSQDPVLFKDVDLDTPVIAEPEIQELKSILKDKDDYSRKRLVTLSKRMRALQLRKHGALRQRLDVDMYVKEARLPPQEAEENVLLKLLRQRRPLKPYKTESITPAYIPSESKIVVNVLRGYNLPSRKVHTTTLNRSSTDENLSDIRVYVEVNFQHIKYKTSVIEGSYPEWNEIMKIPFSLPNDSLELYDIQAVNDAIYFNVYDEYNVDLLEDDRTRDKSVHVRRERNWLGCCSVPFNAIYSQRRFHGMIEVRVPIVLFGYKREHRLDQQPEILDQYKTPTSHETYLEVFVALEPPLPHPTVMSHRFASDEENVLMRYAEHWQRSAMSNHFVLSTVLDLSGKMVHISRYIRAIQPPTGITTIQQIVRFVSIFPALEDRMSLATDKEVWSSCEQFLELGAGDSPEHAVLLCNYLLHAGENAYVLLGESALEGKTAFVLSHNQNMNPTLINPMTGDMFVSSEINCPLTTIGCIFNHENIWMNMQTEKYTITPSFFAIRNTTAWRPFFNAKMPRPSHFASIQTSDLKYTAVSSPQIKSLERHIEDIVINSMETWRRMPTRWNRLLNRLLGNLVAAFESSILSGQHVNESKHYQELEKLQSMYYVNGFPLNLSWRDDKSLVDLLYSTSVWDNDDMTVEFGVAVHCYAYIQSVTSVWVYVACLTKSKGI